MRRINMPFFTAIGQRAAELLTIIAHFRRPFLGGGSFSGRFSGVRGPNFIKLGEDTGRSWPRYDFVSEFRYLAAFSNAGGSKLSDVEIK